MSIAALPVPRATPASAGRGLGRAARRPEVAGAALVVLAVAAAAGAFGHAYVADDYFIILHNDRVHHLSQAWRLFAQTYWPPANSEALYRPLTTLVFAVTWAAGGGAPWLFHLVSVLLYAAVVLAVWRLACRILPAGPAWIAAALFAAHPVHVDAVANAVGQAELWVALWCLVAMILFLDWRRTHRALTGRQVATIAGVYALACLSKEHGIVLPGLLAVTELTLIDDDGGWATRLAGLGRLFLALALVACAYLLMRESVIGSWAGDYPTWAFAHASAATRGWTMLGAVPDVLRLLLWPTRLAVEYGPQEVPIRVRPDLTLVGPALVLVGAAGAGVRLRRRAPVVTFGVAWLAVTLLPTSNLLFPTGIVLAERTLFLPSVGVVMIGGAVAAWASAALADEPRRWRRAAAAVLVLLLLAGITRAERREREWRTDAELAWHRVQDAPLDYLNHYSYGHLLIANGYLADGEREMQLAMALFPGDPQPFAELGEAYAAAHRCPPAMPLFRHALDLLPKHPTARLGLARCLLEGGDYAAARSQARIGLSYPYEREAFRQVEHAADSALRVAGHPGGGRAG